MKRVFRTLAIGVGTLLASAGFANAQDTLRLSGTSADKMSGGFSNLAGKGTAAAAASSLQDVELARGGGHGGGGHGGGFHGGYGGGFRGGYVGYGGGFRGGYYGGYRGFYGGYGYGYRRFGYGYGYPYYGFGYGLGLGYGLGYYGGYGYGNYGGYGGYGGGYYTGYNSPYYSTCYYGITATPSDVSSTPVMLTLAVNKKLRPIPSVITPAAQTQVAPYSVPAPKYETPAPVPQAEDLPVAYRPSTTKPFAFKAYGEK